MNQAINHEDETLTPAKTDACHRELASSLEQIPVPVDWKTYQHFLRILDCPPSGIGFERLMTANQPWRKQTGKPPASVAPLDQ